MRRRPASPSFWISLMRSEITVISCMMIVALMYGFMPMATTLKRDSPPPENRSSSPRSAWELKSCASAAWLAPGTATLAKSLKMTRIPPVKRILFRSWGGRMALTRASSRFIGYSSVVGLLCPVLGSSDPPTCGARFAGATSSPLRGEVSGSSALGVRFAVLAASRFGPIFRGSPITLTEPPRASIASRALELKACASTVSLRSRDPVPRTLTSKPAGTSPASATELGPHVGLGINRDEERHRLQHAPDRRVVGQLACLVEPAEPERLDGGLEHRLGADGAFLQRRLECLVCGRGCFASGHLVSLGVAAGSAAAPFASWSEGAPCARPAPSARL